MKIVSKETPSGETIFCDDIRMEVGNKTSYIGIYSGSINLDKPPPTQLAKFALAIYYSERPGESTDPVRLAIFLPGDTNDAPTVNAELPVEQMRSRPAPSMMEFDDPAITVMMHVVIAPLRINEEGLIKVRAYRGDLEIKLGAIHVLSKPPENEPGAIAEDQT